MVVVVLGVVWMRCGGLFLALRRASHDVDSGVDNVWGVWAHWLWSASLGVWLLCDHCGCGHAGAWRRCGG